VFGAKVKLPAVTENLPTIIAFVSECARKEGFGEDRISEVALAVEEAVVNICLHAYAEWPGEIVITCAHDHDAERLMIEIVDTGKAFDILSARDPDLTEDLDAREIGGLGVFLVRTLTDDLRYSRSANENRLQLFFDRAKGK
jgi:anti-sigma regulatory factor (Ser/Thr protein kinase)